MFESRKWQKVVLQLILTIPGGPVPAPLIAWSRVLRGPRLAQLPVVLALGALPTFLSQ